MALGQHAWLTVTEAAEYLRCGERHLRELMANDQVPHTLFAGKALFYPTRLDEWLLSKEVGPLMGSQITQRGVKTMIEADMERMLRDYPEEFFDEKLEVVSQQEAFRSGITDLIFQDGQGDLLVVELKRGVLQREHVAQVIDYLGDVESRYVGRNVELMVVANIIPPQRRVKLERVGVSFKEIPECRLREVAAKHGTILSEETQTTQKGCSGDRVEVTPDCPRDKTAKLIAELIDYGERFVSGLGRNLKQDLENSDYAWLSTKTRAQLSRWCHPHRHSEREQWVIPRARELSDLLFGEVIDRTAHPSYGS